MRELVAVTAGLAALAAMAFGERVVHGGFVGDDWASVRAGINHPGNFFEIAREITKYFDRPAQARVFAIPVVLFGPAPAGYLAWTLSLALLSAVLFFLLLRAFRLGRWPAAGISALFLALPATDSDRVWAATAPADLAVALFFGGLLLARRGLLARGRAAVGWHGAALVLYASSILIYEIAAPAILLSVFPYAYWAGRRAAVRCWRWDVLVVLASLVVVAHYTDHTDWLSLSAQLSDKAAIAKGAVEVLAESILPIPAAVGVTLGIAGLLVLAALLRWRTLDLETRTRSKQHLKTAALSIAVIAIGYVMFAGSFGYRPTGSAIGDNRVNVLAATGYALYAYSAAALLGLFISPGRRAGARWVTTLALTALLVGYAVRDRGDVRHWNRVAPSIRCDNDNCAE